MTRGCGPAMPSDAQHFMATTCGGRPNRPAALIRHFIIMWSCREPWLLARGIWCEAEAATGALGHNRLVLPALR